MEKREYLGLHNLVAVRGARHAPKRLGRGESSGLGKTSGRGHKGQKARKSGNVRPGFEGGQNPLARRLPKHGFSNSPFRAEVKAINIGMIAERFASGAVVDKPALVAAGLLSDEASRVKVLAKGTIDFAVTLHVDAVSTSAREVIEKAGGKIELL